MRTAQQLNQRQALDINVNTPGLQVTAQPVNTAVQAVDTSRQYLASSNAIADSIIGFGGSLMGLAKTMSQTKEASTKLSGAEAELAALKTQNNALESSQVPGSTISDNYNKYTQSLAAADEETGKKAAMLWGSSYVEQKANSLAEKVQTDYSANAEGFIQGNLQTNKATIDSLYGSLFKEINDVPNEFARESAKNTALKSRDKLLAFIESSDRKVAETTIHTTFKDALSKSIPKLFVEGQSIESLQKQVTDIIGIANNQLFIPTSVIADNVYKAGVDMVKEGRASPEQIETIFNLKDPKGVPISEYVTDQKTLKSTLQEAQSSFLKERASQMDNQNALQNEVALTAAMARIREASDPTAQFKKEIPGLIDRFTTPVHKATAFSQLATATEQEVNRREKEGREFTSEVATAMIENKNFDDYVNGVTKGSVSFDLSVYITMKEKMLKGLQKDYSGEGDVPGEEQAVQQLETLYNIPNMNTATQINTIIANGDVNQLREIGGAFMTDLAKNTEKRKLFMSAIMKNNGEYKDDFSKIGELYDAIRKNPSVMSNNQQMSAILNEINAPLAFVTDEDYHVVMGKIRADLQTQIFGDKTISPALSSWLNSPEAKRIALRNFAEKDKITSRLANAFEAKYQAVGNNWFSKNLIQKVTKRPDFTQALGDFNSLLRKAGAASVFMQAYENNSQIEQEYLGDAKSIDEFLDGVGVEAFGHIEIDENPDNPVIRYYDKRGYLIGFPIDLKQAQEIANAPEDAKETVLMNTETLLGNLKTLAEQGVSKDYLISPQGRELLTDTTLLLKGLSAYSSEARSVVSKNASDSSIKEYKKQLMALWQSHNETLLDTSTEITQSVLRKLNLSQKTASQILNSKDFNVIAIAQNGGFGFDVGHSRHPDVKNVKEHFEKSLEEYKSASVDTPFDSFEGKPFGVFDILMDAVYTVAPPKNNENRIDDYPYDPDSKLFLDSDVLSIVNDVFEPQLAKKFMDTSTKKNDKVSLTSGSIQRNRLRNRLYEVKSRKVEKWFLEKGVTEKEFKQFAINKPEIFGSLVALSAITGNNFNDAIAAIATDDVKKTSTFVIGNNNKYEKSRQVDQIRLMLYGGLTSWSSYNFPK